MTGWRFFHVVNCSKNGMINQGDQQTAPIFPAKNGSKKPPHGEDTPSPMEPSYGRSPTSRFDQLLAAEVATGSFEDASERSPVQVKKPRNLEFFFLFSYFLLELFLNISSYFKMVPGDD